MSDLERQFHETWLGMVQPIEGLVVSVPVLVDAQCIERQLPEVQSKLLGLCPVQATAGAGAADGQGPGGEGGRAIRDLGELFGELLGLTPDLFDVGDALPEDLSLYVPEGRQLLRPTMGLRKLDAKGGSQGQDGHRDTGETGQPQPSVDATAASKAGERYVALVLDVAAAATEGLGLDLDKPETVTGSWDYPAAAKFDRLLRHCRVPIGILTNHEVVRLVYAPHGESSGHITFRIDDMATVGGRPILDAFVMLLSASRFFGVAEERALPALLAESRKRQANVTNELAEQVFDALQVLLRGFEAAAERDGRDILDDALAREGDHLYKGLLTVLLRLVFLLYAEDRGLLPTEQPLYAEHMSVLGLFQALQEDAGAHPDSMSRRFGAWGRLLAIFRAVFLGVEHGELRMPARRGTLFDPHRFPFLEGWGPAGSAPIVMAEDRAAVRVPTVDDETIFRVLEKLVLFEGQRLSYRTLDVEQIGSVYEALMGFHVLRLPSGAVCMRPNGVWLTAEELREVPPARRPKWLKEVIGLSTAQAAELSATVQNNPALQAEAWEETGMDPGESRQVADRQILDALTRYAKGRPADGSWPGARRGRPAPWRAQAGQLVLQPGAERRRTSSHYTPRSLSAPIVRRTLEPLLACMGTEPSSEALLELKICDPAMGSGAFLVEACRFVGDALVAAWTREGRIAEMTGAHEDPVLHARRMVAQRCLYGVDKNESAVELAKLSLWLVTLAKDLPFTFIDHALRHGDSLVGLSFDQIRAFHWKPEKQVHLAEQVLKDALDEAITIRQEILGLAADPSPEAQREKRRLLLDSEDACQRAKLVGDVVVGAFFAHDNDKDRETERLRRLDLAERWLTGDGTAEAELRELQATIRERLPVFHWMLEFPEVFYAERPDPLDEERVNRAAFMDAFVGNPPFMAKAAIIEQGGQEYVRWLLAVHADSSGAADVVAHFFRRAGALIGQHGTVGLVATNTIAQGDTRQTGLVPLMSSGFLIYDAVRSMTWPGTAAVVIAIVHMAVGNPGKSVSCRLLDGLQVSAIDSRLRQGVDRRDPVALACMAELRFMGPKAYGLGFILTQPEREALVAEDPKNAACLFPYLGGDELNTSPSQSSERHVIYFGQRSLQEAEQWPALLGLVRERVWPERAKAKETTADGAHRKKYWWQFAQPRPELFEALADLKRCLVTARVTKHMCFSFQHTDRLFNEKLYVFPLDRDTHFAILQSRVHGAWTWLLSSTMKTDLNYSASDCFDTFPFPQPDPRTVIPSLEAIGERLYSARAKYMLETQQGLTQTYNKLKDPSCHDAPIAELRRMHEEMDRAVLDAYGWSDVVVPPFCPASPAEQAALEAFNDEVIDRLFALNAERAEEERLAGLGGGKKGKQAVRGKKGGGTVRDGSDGQGELGFGP